MSELLDRKLRHFFTLMDRGRSDTLELNDYLIAADSVSTAFGIATGTAEHDGMRLEFTRFWESIVKPMDTDGDGHVNVDEYLAAYTAGVVDNPQGYESIRPIADAIISMADTESDGKITPDNFTIAMSSAYGIPEPECRAAFATLDKDTNGHLTRDELHHAAEQYFLGTDPELPGNTLFGQF